MTRFAAQAPVLVLLLSKLDFLTGHLGKQIQGVPFHMLDMGIAGEHFVLRAEELGLGTCWIGWFAMRAVRRFFRIPRAYKMVSLLALGYPAARPPRERVRKTLDEIAWFNKFGGSAAATIPAHPVLARGEVRPPHPPVARVARAAWRRESRRRSRRTAAACAGAAALRKDAQDEKSSLSRPRNAVVLDRVHFRGCIAGGPLPNNR